MELITQITLIAVVQVVAMTGFCIILARMIKKGFAMDKYFKVSKLRKKWIHGQRVRLISLDDVESLGEIGLGDFREDDIGGRHFNIEFKDEIYRGWNFVVDEGEVFRLPDQEEVFFIEDRMLVAIKPSRQATETASLALKSSRAA